MSEPNVSRVEHAVPLREYVEEKLSGWCRYFESRLKAIEDAVKIASAASDRRLDSMNEFRSSLKDQNATFITKAEANAQWESIEKDLRLFRQFQAGLEGKASQRAVNGALVLSAIGLLMSLLNTVLNLMGR